MRNLSWAQLASERKSFVIPVFVPPNSLHQILGRANEISSFVKHGKESGYIEIELKGAKGQKNLVIRRNLSAKSKGSTLTLNGQSCTGKEITNRMAKLNVQVGNLWYLAFAMLRVDLTAYMRAFQFILASGQGLRVRTNDSTAVA